MNNDSAVPGLNRIQAHSIRVRVPALPEQRAIAHILGTLDDKIELNRRMNETLEEMARALFKSWFVDFDPVRAKAEGRQPAGIDAATAALFPNAFEASALGPMPKGWLLSTAGQALTVLGGSTPSTAVERFWNGEIAFATPKDLSLIQSPVLAGTERRITEAGLAEISSGLLPPDTVLLSSRAPIGYLAIAAVPVSINQGIVAMVCDGEVSNYYSLFWAQANMDLIESYANGTTFLEISKSSFKSLPMLVPSRRILARFDALVSPLFRRIASNMRESSSLISLRDSLLPKLLSGDIRMKETEPLLAETPASKSGVVPV